MSVLSTQLHRTGPASRATAPMMAIDISIIIVSWNVRDCLRACLDSIERHRDDLSLEVIVVDNASTDGTPAMIRDEFPAVTLTGNDMNAGFARANNQGLAIGRGQYFLLLNPDTELHAGALATALEHAESHPGVGVVGCRAIRPDGSVQSTAFRCLRLRDIALNILVPNAVRRRVPLLGGLRYADRDLDRVQDVETVAGCFMLVRRTAWEWVGGLDESFFMYGEEAEWCHRLRRAGWTVCRHPGATILHHGGVSAEQCRDAMTLAMARSQVLLMQRTQGRLAAWMANALMMLRDLPRASVWLIVRLFAMHWGATRWAAWKRSAARFRLHAAGLLRTDFEP
jgi:hypothetical protein